MKQYNGRVAVVTGAASGMGRSMAVKLAAAGAKVAICDVDPVGLDETAQLCAARGATPLSVIVNVAEREAMLAFAEQVVEAYGAVHYVFNNAGIAFIGTFERSGLKDFERVIDVDFWGVVNGTHAFLPHLIAADEGHLVNTSSVFGIFGVPTQTAYNAAKFAVRGFTESLRQEMLIDHPHVKVSCVHPGGIKTAIAKNASSDEGDVDEKAVGMFDKYTLTTADRAADIILKGAAAGKQKILVGPDAVVIDLLIRTLGSWYQRPLARGAKKLLPERFNG